MSGTFKMTKLDYYTAKTLIFENIVATFVIAGIFSFMESSMYTLCFTAAWYAALSATNIFMIQDKNGLERLYASLSLDNKNIVSGRYLFCYIQYLIILGVTVIIGVGAMFLFGNTLQFMTLLTAVCESLLVFTAVTCIQIPICLRLPYAKARFWCVIVLLVVVALATYTALNMSSIWDVDISIKINQGPLSAICMAVSIAVLLISYPIAVGCYRTRMRTN
ncbi:MAG: ABC-2 transporter permease [Lachnospiraceae bacterium]|nr:ABC-2 transporter permease [Lachnospiraceae bacterium]